MKKENEMSEKTYSIDLPAEASEFLDTATEEQKEFVLKEFQKLLEKLRAEATDDKAYIIRFEDFCADHHPPVKLTLEPHT